MWDIDDQGTRALAAELGDEWTEVEPGIYFRVESAPSLHVIELPEPPHVTKGVA